MAPHTWSNLGDTVSDATHHMYYRGQRIKEAYYRGEKIWGEEEEPQAEFLFKYHVEDQSSYFSLNGNNIKYSVNGHSKVDIGTNRIYLRDMFRQYGNTCDIKIYGENLRGLSMNSKFTLREIVIPFGKAFEGVTSWASTFYRCSYLSKVPDYLFVNTPNVTSFASCFELTSVDSLPAHMFGDLSKVTSFARCFLGTDITEVPDGAFDGASNVTYFNQGFQSCWKLTKISEDMFSSMPNLVNVSSCFAGCDALEDIPKGLFDNNPKIISFDRTFQNCNKIANIPSDLFQNQIDATSFKYCFYHCSSVRSISSDLFANNRKVTTFSDCFAGCSELEYVPDGLFRNAVLATDYSSCFTECSSLTSIGRNLFASTGSGYDQYKLFSYTFYNCVKLQSIPNDLFYTAGTRLNGDSCFAGCSSLQTIPSDLLTNNQYAGKYSIAYWLESMFKNCSSLEYIPDNLFKFGLTSSGTYPAFELRSSASMFEGCERIMSIPIGLFDGVLTGHFISNRGSINISRMFALCTLLESIPKNLFNIFIRASGYPYWSAPSNYNGVFYGCSGITDDVPELWDTFSGYTGTECYYGCINAENYADIPSSWK